MLTPANITRELSEDTEPGDDAIPLAEISGRSRAWAIGQSMGYPSAVLCRQLNGRWYSWVGGLNADSGWVPAPLQLLLYRSASAALKAGRGVS